MYCDGFGGGLSSDLLHGGPESVRMSGYDPVAGGESFAVPIRFRCTNCNQLMGIARRKAGSVVHCPACQKEIAVPIDADDDPPTPESAPMPAPIVSPRAGLFDRDDFDALLAGGASMDGARPAPPAGRPLAAHPPHPAVLAVAKGGNFSFEPAGVTLAPMQGGIFVSPGWATMLTVVFLLLLALAFALGLLVGRHVL